MPMLPTTSGAAKLEHEQHVPANKVVSVHSRVQIVVRAVTTAVPSLPLSPTPSSGREKEREDI